MTVAESWRTPSLFAATAARLAEKTTERGLDHPCPTKPVAQLIFLNKVKKSQMNTPGTTLEDKILVQGALAGQTEYFSVLVDRHVTAVKRCIQSLVRNPLDVEDLVQDTFLKAWLHLSTFRFQASFRTWLLSVAHNEALALYRRRNSRPFCPPAVNLEALPLRSQSESPHQALTRSEARVRIHSAMAKLPRKYRQVLVFCELQQLTIQETATQMKASTALVKTRLFRARHMLSVTLRKEIARRGWDGTRHR